MENDQRRRFPSTRSLVHTNGNYGYRLPSSTQRSILPILGSDRSGSFSRPATPDLLPISQVVAKRSGIPSIAISNASDDEECPHLDMKADSDTSFGLNVNSRILSPHRRPGDGTPSSLASSKKKTYHLLSLRKDKDDEKQPQDERLQPPLDDSSPLLEPSTWKRRAASMPEPGSKTSANTNMDMWHRADSHAARFCHASGSPPIVDFTRFEDRYRGSSRDYDGLLAVSNGHMSRIGMGKGASSFHFGGSKSRRCSDQNVGETKSPLDSEVMGRDLCIHADWKISEPIGKSDDAETQEGRYSGVEITDSGGRTGGTIIPASKRKPDPGLIISSLRNILGDLVDFREYFDMGDLARTHEVDRSDFAAKIKSVDVGHRNSMSRDQPRSESMLRYLWNEMTLVVR